MPRAAAAERVLALRPQERSAAEQDELREWVLDVFASSTAKTPAVARVPRDQQRLLFGQLRGLSLSPHELLQPVDQADHHMYIVLRGELRAFGNGSHVGTVGVGGSVGLIDEEEYHHTDSHHAGAQGCVLGVLDYAHSLAAQGRTMPVATQVLQKDPAQRTAQDVRVLLALLEDLPFFQQLPTEAEQLGCCHLLRLQELQEGAMICREGSIGEMFFIVLRGSVDVRVEAEEHSVERLGVGGSFGKLSLLSEIEEERILHSTIVAGPQCVCATLHREEFKKAAKETRARLAAVLAKPCLGRSRADVKLVQEMLEHAVMQNIDGGQPSKVLAQIAGHATLVRLAAGETAQLPGGSFVLALEGRAVVAEGPGLLLTSSGSDEGRRGFGFESLLEASDHGSSGARGNARTQLMPIRAKDGVCELLVVCSTDIRHVQRRTALQPLIDEAWALCSNGSSDHIKQLEWTDMWKGVLKTLAPAGAFSSDAALAWCVSDWDVAIKRTLWGARMPSDVVDELHHAAFSQALTSQIEEFWGIAEPCPELHASWLAEVLETVSRSHASPGQSWSNQRLLELSMVKCRSDFFLGLRGDAHELMQRPQGPPGQRSALERVEAELNDGSFSLAEAFDLEKSAPPFFGGEDEAAGQEATQQAMRALAFDTSRVSHLASAAAAAPSQWLTRLDAWARGEMQQPDSSAVDGIAEENEDEMNCTGGSVEWARRSALHSDDESSEEGAPVNPVHPPPAKMLPVALLGGPPPKNEQDIRMASPPREKAREGPSQPPAGVKLQGSPVPRNRAPVPPKTPPPVKRRTHKEIAKEIFAQRHTGGVIQKVASEESLGGGEGGNVVERRLPVVAKELTRSGNTQSWAPKDHKLPQEIHIGNAQGYMRPFQAPPDPRSQDPETGEQKNRHRTAPTKPLDSPRNSEKRASARAERQKIRAAKAAATRTVVPGKLAPEPPRTVLQPNIIGTARQEQDMLTAEPEKVVRVTGVDTNPDRTYAVLPAGVPKEWIALHYKSEKKREAQKKQASAQCAAAIARGVKVKSAHVPVKVAAKKKMPFAGAIAFTGIGNALQGGGDVITAAQTITGAERWLVRDEGALGPGRPPEVVPSATAYGHSGPRKPLERLAPPSIPSPWCAAKQKHPARDRSTPKAARPTLSE
jgi:hypothetical protein